MFINNLGLPEAIPEALKFGQETHSTKINNLLNNFIYTSYRWVEKKFMEKTNAGYGLLEWSSNQKDPGRASALVNRK